MTRLPLAIALDLKPMVAEDSSMPLAEREGSFSGDQCPVVIVLWSGHCENSSNTVTANLEMCTE